MVGFIFLIAISASALFSFFNEIGPDLPAEAYQIGTATSIVIFFIYVGIGFIYFFPIYYLHKFDQESRECYWSKHEGKGLIFPSTVILVAFTKTYFKSRNDYHYIEIKPSP